MQTAHALARQALREGRLTVVRGILQEYPAVSDGGRMAALALREGHLDLLPELPPPEPISALSAGLQGPPTALQWVEEHLTLPDSYTDLELTTLYLSSLHTGRLTDLERVLGDHPPPPGTLYHALLGLHPAQVAPLAEGYPDLGEIDRALATRLGREDGASEESWVEELTAAGLGPVSPTAVAAVLWAAGLPEQAARVGEQLGSSVDWSTATLEEARQHSPLPVEEIAVHVFPEVGSVARLQRLWEIGQGVDWSMPVRARLSNTLWPEDDPVHEYLLQRWPENGGSLRDSPDHLRWALWALCRDGTPEVLRRFRDSYPELPLGSDEMTIAAVSDNLPVLQDLLQTLDSELAGDHRQVWDQYGPK